MIETDHFSERFGFGEEKETRVQKSSPRLNFWSVCRGTPFPVSFAGTRYGGAGFSPTRPWPALRAEPRIAMNYPLQAQRPLTVALIGLSVILSAARAQTAPATAT